MIFGCISIVIWLIFIYFRLTAIHETLKERRLNKPLCDPVRKLSEIVMTDCRVVKNKDGKSCDGTVTFNIN